ncbi:MAG: M48 family metalloprotease, partial [Desulfobacterales bacterium]
MKKSNLFGCMVVIVVVIMLAGCARYTEVTLPSVEWDKAVGRKIDFEVKTMMGIYDPTDLTAYVQKVGKQVAAFHDDQRFDYEFAIVDQAEANAFAIPNGRIYVSRGLLALTSSEDELAQVLGHEIVHVSRRHMARRLARARIPTLLSLPGKVVGSVLSERLGSLVNAPIYLAGGAAIFKHDRQDEFESDNHGQALAARAGYDPAALSAILNRMEKADQTRTGKQQKTGFFSTHPSTPDRIERLTRAALEIKWSPRPGVSDRQGEYLHQLEGLLVGKNPAEGVFRERKFLHPVADFAVIFPKDWKLINTRKVVLGLEP